MAIKFLKHFKQSEKTSHIIYLQSHSDFCSSVSYTVGGKAYKIPTRDFTAIINDRTFSADDLIGRPFPVAVRMIDKNQYVIERPPFKTSIRFTPKKASRVRKEAGVLCEVWIPWTVAIITLPDKISSFPQVRLFFNDGPLSSVDDQLTPVLTPNAHYGVGALCWGQTDINWREEVRIGRASSQNLADIYYFYINDYFNGGWNLDLGIGHLQNLCHREIGKFTNNPLDNPELVERANQCKLKIDNVSASSKDGVKVKNAYYVWSLLTLEEVLFSITEFKKSFPTVGRCMLKNILVEFNREEEKTEIDFLNLISQKMSFHSSDVFWEYTLEYNEEFISQVNQKASIIGMSTASLHYRNLIQEAFSNFYLENKDAYLNAIKKSINSIVDIIDSYDSMDNKPIVKIVHSMNDILDSVVEKEVLC